MVGLPEKEAMGGNRCRTVQKSLLQTRDAPSFPN
jgi:hypothetical protein